MYGGRKAVGIDARLDRGQPFGELDVEPIVVRILQEQQARSPVAERYPGDIQGIPQDAECSVSYL